MPKTICIHQKKPAFAKLLDLDQATSSQTSEDSSKISHGQWQILDQYLGDINDIMEAMAQDG